MEINNFRKKFNGAIDVLEKFNKAGYEAYFVGGCVRDFLLGCEFSDIDITTNALPKEVKTIFRKSIDTGIQHGTVTILVDGESYEVTTFRTEDDYIDHRTPEKVEFVSNLRDDLDRRDFTINAMALDSKGNLYDYHNGKKDLTNKIIKTVNNPNERFFEDALRMLRAFRFSSKLGFEIEDSTLDAIKKNAELIKFVSVERITNEFKKLLAGIGSKRSLELLLDSKLNTYIPFLSDIISFVDCSKYTFCQSLYILTKLNNISFEKLRDLKLSNKEIKKIKEYERINLEFLDNRPLELILYKYDKDDIYFIVEYFDYCDKKNIDIINLPISSFNDIAITSTEIISIIDKSPGPWMKEVTKKLEEAILLNKINNTENNIVDFLKKIRDNI
ncbi:MAG: CCA tRNA nucleotidyltransferase [Gemella haemolysans]|jgi:tRNA adenylyltransferase|uniref:CCA tRNA nucleotidyltransferase n=1 Tax=Gemella haemolysans TaxID=1379 RepID=UPI0006609696|nr:CCA tRNA nucleotidyltransferase [Gemella haemolysans]MDU6572706.1 CCA tRNA nucleotidyltransferase [Gemella haemolysans]